MNSDRNLEPSLFQFLKQSGPYTDPTYHTDQDNYQALLESKILVIGAGGLGCEILKDLSLTGFKNIHVIDMDTIDISNLNRQFLFRQNDIGKSKAEVAAAFVMERVKGCNITPFFGKIQDMPLEYYKQFNCIIAGLDSVEARRWINATIVNLYEPDDFENTFIPLIDGGTEGFKGQSRVILPKMTACYECSLNLLTTKATYPVCTIANTPRLPEHCIEWALQLEWPRHFGQRKFDSDSSEDVDWIYAKSLERGKFFGINGITRSLTLGVAKNIIPAIASTNAIIAASCCNEAFKIITSCNPILEEYMMYSGSDSIFTYTFQMEKREDCPVCGYAPKTIEIPKWYTLRDFIENKVKSSNEGNNNNIQINKPSLRTNSKNLYLQSPEFLEKTTRPNLDKKLS
ncbi:hypothetical protein PACTADRAFT_50408, partial [Pachysolen tannophilus NRRL Y-2460]